MCTMRKVKRFLKKSTALLLSVLMLIPNLGIMPVSADNSAVLQPLDNNVWSGTAGELIAENYPLNDYEKAILGCSGLTGGSFTVEVPDSTTEGLVTVDADAQTVVAKPYVVDGFTWEPTAAVLKYTNADGTPGTDLEVTLNKVGEVYTGNFNKPANSYRVEVTYSLFITLDETVQKLLLNAPMYLTEGYIQMDDAVNGSLAVLVATLDDKMEELRALYNGIHYDVMFEGEVVAEYTIGLAATSEAKKAIGNLLADYDKNGGKSTLLMDFDAYRAASSKVQFMLENGATVKEHIDWFYLQIATIDANSADLLDVAEQLEVLATGTGDGTIAEAKKLIDEAAVELNEKLEEKIQTEIIDVAVKTAKDDYNLDISSLEDKTRKNDAVYKEIDALRATFEKNAKDAEEVADFLEKMGGDAAKIEEYRNKAKLLRDEGIPALDTLEQGIRDAYALGDEKIAELVAKKADLDAYAVTAEEKAQDIRNLVNPPSGDVGLPQIKRGVQNYYRQVWQYTTQPKLVKDDITAAEYAQLDAAVKKAVDPISGESLALDHSTMTIKDKLLATETVIEALVDQFVVYVDLKAQAVSMGAVNSTALIDLPAVSINLPLDKETSAADVLAAIEGSNVEASALAQWDSYYNIGTANYDRVVTLTAEADGEEIKNFTSLTEDIRYIINYIPKKHTITETYLPAGEDVTEVPYGYNWRLPRPADLTKSYDYTVNGDSYLENTVLRVTENLVVSREEGKAVAAKSLAELIAISRVPGAQLSAKEKAVLSSNAFHTDTVYYRTPDSNDKLTKVTALSANNFRLEAKPMNAGLISDNDAQWTPVSAYPIVAGGSTPFALTEENGVYVGTFACDADFESVQVIYQLTVSTNDANKVAALTNIADVLVAETAAQKATLDDLCTKNNFYANLGQVTATVLGSVSSVVTDMTPAAKAALNKLTTECINGETGLTYLYEYLTQYKSENGGLPYYYKGNNAVRIKNQIEMVNEYLPIVWNDKPVQNYIDSMPAMAAEASKIEAVMAQLDAVDLLSVNALVNTNSPYIDNMLAAVLADGTTASHSNVGGDVILETTLSAVAPGLTAYGVEIQVLNKNDGKVESYKSEAYRAQGNVVTVAEWQAMYDALLATIPNAKYYTVTKELPTVDVTLGENAAIYVSAMRPLTYTVKIDGEADQVLYAFDAYTITLPGTGSAGLKYRYNVGGSQVEVTSGALENFALATTIDAVDALFGADRELVITRELVDVNKEGLLNFINKLNTAFANGGLSANGKLAAAFIPLTDSQGNLSVVLRISNNYQSLSPASLANEMMDLIQDLSYVGINGSPLFGLNSDNEMKLYLQTIINMMVNSGVGLDTIPAIVDNNGNIIDMKLPGAKVVGATGNSLPVGNCVINDLDQLGGKLITSTMQYGVNVNNATSVPFYVTYQDFDTQAELLKKAKKGAQQILPYFNLNCKDGAVNMMVNAPDSAYAYFLTAMLIVGKVDLDTLQSYELQEVLEYVFELIDPMFETEGISADSFINTVAETGFYSAIKNFDTEANRALVDLIYNSIDHLYDNTSATGSSVGGKYSGVFTYDALDVLLNNKVALGDYKTMIAELDTGLSLPITFNLRNRDADYQALVIDVRAGETTDIHKKYYMTRNVVDAISKVGDDSIVVLLSDIRGDITVNNDIILNLNGCSIDGNVTAKGVVSIVDSTLDTKKCGSVVGDLIVSGGDFILGGGKYLRNVEKYLEEGYSLKNSIVTNGLFTIAQNGEDLNVYLDTDYLTLSKSAAKIMAIDVLFKLWMNYYSCSELVVDGNALYSVDLKNVTESLNTPSLLVSKGLACIDCAGATAFATQFMEDVTDFGALADAVDSGDVLVSYLVQNAAFDPYMQYEANGDYFSFNVEASADVKKYTKLNVLLNDDVPADQQTKISRVLRELDTIVSFEDMKVSIDRLSYDSAGLHVDGAALADVKVDLSKNVNYPIIIGAILADNAKGAEKEALVDAIEHYQTSSSAIALKNAIETATAAELTAALKATKNKSFHNILAGLGLTAPEAEELESLYTIARKVVATVIEYSDKTGGNRTLLGVKVDGEYATYRYRLDKSADAYAQLTLVLFSEEKAITVKDKNNLIYLTTDDLAEVFDALRDGATIFVNKAAVLSKDVTLPALSFKLMGAANIDFNGKFLTFVEGNTKLTTDKDLTANITWDRTLFCSDVTCTQMGEFYIFRLDGSRHEWEDIEAVKPDCENPGSTAGVWCKHCHKYQDGKEPQPIDPTGHDYTSQVIDPTCFDEGYTLHTCGNCGDTYKTDFVDPTNHEGTTEVLKGYGATCTVDGLTDGLQCTKCGTILKPQEPITAGHTPEEYVVKPTCTEPGIAGASKCKVCGEMLEEGTVVFPTGHGVVVVDGQAPTCTENGWTSYAYCPICNHVHKEKVILTAPGHKVVIDIAKEATCTENGWTEGSHCEVCGEVFTEQIMLPVADHKPVIDPAVKPSADNIGWTEGSHCEVCGKVLVEQKELAKLPYIHVPTVKVEATDGVIRGAKVDTTNNRVYLDTNPEGFTVKEFADVHFQIDNAFHSHITVYQPQTNAVRGDNERICNGDKVKVWATNVDGVEVVAEYVLIIMGDANCDGKLNARDSVMLDLAFVDEMTLEGVGMLAADMNFDGKLNARDSVACDLKYVLWDENGYVSQTK